MQQIMLFENEEFGQLRMVFIDGKQYFVGKDVATILGYVKPLNALATHVDEDDSLKQGLIDSMGRIQETILINESGLYSLILSSKLPKAKAFKRWVTSEVLPSIREKGGYGIGIEQIIQQTATEVAKAIAKEMIPILEGRQIKKERRRGGTIARLDVETRRMIEDILCSGMYTYAEVTKMLNEGGVEISLTSVHRYAQSIGL